MLKCPDCDATLELLVPASDKHWPGWDFVWNRLFRCEGCCVTGLEASWLGFRATKYTLRNLLKVMGERLVCDSSGACCITGNWDVMVDGQPYQPAAETFEKLVELLSGRELRLPMRYRKSGRGENKIYCGKIEGF